VLERLRLLAYKQRWQRVCRDSRRIFKGAKQMYKLIKFKVDGNCLTPCPYGLIGVGRIMVYSASCNECKHNKGKVKKQVKCSFEYDTKEPSEIKTGKVTSSDCVQVADEKPKAEKSCSNCYYEKDDSCREHECNHIERQYWKPKHTENKLEKVNCLSPKFEEVKKYKYVCKSCDLRKCKCTFNDKTSFTTNEYCHIANCYANYELKRVKEKHNDK
jgi:hypothetical protein